MAETGFRPKEKAPANSHLQGLLNKWSQPLSPGCSEESSWTVTVQGRTGETLAKKKPPANSHLQGLLCKWSQPLSRVLSWTVIRLGPQSLTGSSNLPAPNAGRAIRGPIWSCFGWSLPCHGLLPAARCALTAPFQPYLIPLAWAIGGLLSVALVVGSRPPGVTWHPALWSPDFPPAQQVRRRLLG